MKNDVLISIRGICTTDDDQDVVEMFTTGKYYKKDGCYHISYNESEATGFGKSKTTLTVDKNRMVTLERQGAANSQLIVERGVRHQCYYDVGFGDLMIGVMGSRIKSTLNDRGGNLEFRYLLDIEAMHSSENEMYIHIEAKS